MSARLPSPLYCDLFYTSPGAAEFRRDYLNVWIQVFLGTKGPTSYEELAQEYSVTYKDSPVDPSMVRSACEALSDAGLLLAEESLWRLSSRGEAIFLKAQNTFRDSRRRFLTSVLDYVESVTSSRLTEIERDALRECAEVTLIRSLLDEHLVLQRLFSSVNTEGGARHIARTRTGFDDCLGERLPESQKTRLLELRNDAVDGIGAAASSGADYLHTLHQSVVAAFFLFFDPYHIKNVRDILLKRIYYLDTNSYLAWFYPSQTPHGAVKPLFELLRRHGAELRILRQTVEEIEYIEEQASKAISRSLQDLSYRLYLRGHRKAISADFWLKRDRDRNLTPRLFRKLFMGAESKLEKNGVVIDDVELEGHETHLPTFRNAVKAAKMESGNIVREDAVDHDATALLSVAKLQRDGDSDAWGSAVRFLSLDSNLDPAIGEIRNALGWRIERTDDPRVLARMLVPTEDIRSSRVDYQDFVVNLVRENLGVSVAMRGYDSVYIVEKLEQAGLPVASLLEVPSDVLEGALADLYYGKSLQPRLELALASESEAERAEFIEDVKKELSEALALRSELEEETDKKLNEERKLRQEAEAEVRALKRRIEELEGATGN